MAACQSGNLRASTADSGNGQYVEFLSIAASVLGGAILQVFLSPPTIVTASAANEPEAFGYCLQLGHCPAWQRCWQLSSVVAFCFVILSLICCGTAAVAQRTHAYMAAAVACFYLSFAATTAAVLASVFLSASRAVVLATCALLICLLAACLFFGFEGFSLWLQELLAPQLFKAVAATGRQSKPKLTCVKMYKWLGASASWAAAGYQQMSSDSGEENPQHLGCCFSFLQSKSCATAASGSIGDTALHLAARHGQVDLMKVLLRGRVDKEATNSLGCTALHVAASGGHTAVVKALLDAHADVSASDSQGRTPLHLAVSGSHHQTMKLLTVAAETAGSLNAADHRGLTALHLALGLDSAAMPHSCIVLHSSLTGTAAPDEDCESGPAKTARTAVLAKLDCDGAQQLLDHGADAFALTKDGWTPLLAAFRHGHQQSAETAGAEGWQGHLDSIKKDYSITEDSYKEVVQSLLESLQPGDVRIDTISPDCGLTALQLAIKRNWKTTALSLLSAGAIVDVPGTEQTSLALACITVPAEPVPRCHGADLIANLIEYGASLECKDKNGNTALHTCISYLSHAARSDHTGEDNRAAYYHIFDCAMVLLSRGADVNARNSAGVTPLMLAVSAPGKLGSTAVTMLLSYRPELEVEDGLGNTALHHAIRAGTIQAVELLLTVGAHPEQASRQGLTPLQLASQPAEDEDEDEDEMADIAIELIKNGADVNSYVPMTTVELNLQRTGNRFGILEYDACGHVLTKMPPLMHAIMNNRSKMVSVLLNFGADWKDKGGSHYHSPLFCAAEKAEDSIVTILLDSGADANEAGPRGHRPLHAAATVPNLSAIQALLSRGADAGFRNGAGQRAFDVVGDGPDRHAALCALADAMGEPRPDASGAAGADQSGANNPSATGSFPPRHSGPTTRHGPLRCRSILIRKQPLPLRPPGRRPPVLPTLREPQPEKEEDKLQDPVAGDDCAPSGHVQVVVQPNGCEPLLATPVPAALAGQPAAPSSPAWRAVHTVARLLRFPLRSPGRSPSVQLLASPEPPEARRKLPMT